MRTILAGMLLATTILAAPAAAKPARISAPQAAAHPSPQTVDTFIGTILADAPDAATIDRRCNQFIAEIDRRQALLEAQKGTATLAATLRPYDDLIDLIGALSGEATLYREVMADDARRKAGGACEVKASSASSKLSLSRGVYDRLKAIDASHADGATRLYLTRTLAAFERAGIAKDAAGRADVQKMQDELAQLGTDFESNIANGRKTVTADPAELTGLPADFIAAHKPGADGKVTISTDYPDYVPVMTYAASEALRKRLYESYQTRAYPQNDAKLRAIFDLRQKLATTLGRPNYASLALEDKMLDTPDKVETLLTQMADAARPAGDRDYAKKLALLQQTKPGATVIDPWNNGWLGQQVQKATYSYDRQEARQYFAYDNVRDGILQLTQDLFGVQIRPWKTATWDPLVETYEMLDHGKVIGRFYFDSHPRPGKYNHANMVPVRSGIAGRSIPVGALVMNLPAGSHATGLMEHNDVVTFLHEFGHMLHGMFSGGQQWAGVGGISTEWDFVEAPSQMLEEWVFDYDTLKTFAVNKDGKPIPPELVAKMNRARYFGAGMGDMTQLGLSNISLKFHEAPAPADLGAATRAFDARYDMIKLPDTVQFQDSFDHLNGYSAFYYTYRWSKVIADDMFTQFAKAGLRDRATADRYRRTVLQPGGSKPAAELVAAFLGRPISLDAYRAEMAKDQ
ncbi:M3 family metallopeptidase [Novosphingobium lentum]|uniref:M3 family metallopeptidase n=1 Tax=Novosphingobium lentum TaxID=145287 RepID=UPI00083075F1|nr:M3 family metallopeptidase [Novosphingobium lentum]